jgi:hypothetical protein
LAFFLNFLSPADRDDLRQALTTRYQLDPVAVSQTLWSSVIIILGQIPKLLGIEAGKGLFSTTLVNHHSSTAGSSVDCTHTSIEGVA